MGKGHFRAVGSEDRFTFARSRGRKTTDYWIRLVDCYGHLIGRSGTTFCHICLRKHCSINSLFQTDLLIINPRNRGFR